MSEPVISLDRVDVVYRLAHSHRVSIKEFARDLVGGALSYTEFRALRQVSLTIGAGESVGIIGPNGAGKSTLLKVMAGALRPTRGSCRVGGRLSVVLDAATGFDAELTGAENVQLAGLLLGRSRAEIATAMEGIVATSGLGDFIDSPLRSYSSGMAARLSFAVSMAWSVDVLLTDETLGVGDAAFRERCIERMLDLRRAGQTIVAVSHDRNTILRLCDRAIWIDRGSLVADGPAADLLLRYEGAGSSAAS
jgi:ABC-type polysaccharide/polyol phosphate transport system ATPase subunit